MHSQAPRRHRESDKPAPAGCEPALIPGRLSSVNGASRLISCNPSVLNVVVAAQVCGMKDALPGTAGRSSTQRGYLTPSFSAPKTEIKAGEGTEEGRTQLSSTSPF